MKPAHVVLGAAAVVAAAGAVLYALRPGPATVPLPAARNVVLISIDTLRADHLGCYGYSRPTSPNIDALAEGGARFEWAISSSSWTVPAHMTMLTGMEPPAHGAHGYPRPRRLRGDVSTLAEILSQRGFRTAAFTGGGYMAATFGFDRGFHKFASLGRHFSANLAAARRWVENNRQRPLFLFLHGYDVHRPYTPPPRYARLFSGDYSGSFGAARLAANHPRPSDADLRFVISQYDAEIRAVDDLVGDLLREWKATGFLENTLVIITSDHGEEFYEHGHIYHAHSLYDELLRVPLIFVGPGVTPGVYRTQVGLVDIAPTVLGALGVAAVEPGMVGVDLTPTLVHGSEPPRRLLFSFLRYSAVPFSTAAVRSDRWKLIAWNASGLRSFTLDAYAREYLYKLPLQRREDFLELFDLHQDKEERRDLSEVEAERRERLAQVLARRRVAPEGAAAGSGRIPHLRQSDVEALEALGYL